MEIRRRETGSPPAPCGLEHCQFLAVECQRLLYMACRRVILKTRISPWRKPASSATLLRISRLGYCRHNLQRSDWVDTVSLMQVTETVILLSSFPSGPCIAVFTASAGHLTRLACCRGQATWKIIFNGIPMSALTPDAAIRYH